MADKYNAADADYEQKFQKRQQKKQLADTQAVRSKEEAGDASWKTATKKKQKQPAKKGRFGFSGSRNGKLRKGSAFSFIAVVILVGVWYTSVFAPNILLVNMKEMYTNDLADATVALDTYYKKMMNYKIGRADCSEKISIKCKLSTMSRTQKEAFEKQGFTVIGSKVIEDLRDDGLTETDLPQQRYQVTAIIPPIQSPGIIATGDMLWAYSQMSLGNKALVNSVFDSKSGFFQDAKFSQRLKDKYDLTKKVTVTGKTEQQVNKSFDKSMTGSKEGLDMYGRPNTTGGIGLGSLRNPVSALPMITAANNLAAQSNSYVGLQCAWYSFAKSVTNNAKTAKAHTVARFAMQYLKQADAVKAGIAEEIPTNVLSSKLAYTSARSYGGDNATDSPMYQSIVNGTLPIPSLTGLLFYLGTFDLTLALAPAWSQIMMTSSAVGAASGAPGSLFLPPGNLTGNDRTYCLAGETLESHGAIKNQKCTAAITASAPMGWQEAMVGPLKTGDETCPPPYIDYSEGFPRPKGEFLTQPSLKATSTMLTSYIGGLFSANVIAWANVMYMLFTSQTTGTNAGDAIFAGTGEILGDMAMSRGMMPSNQIFMAEYLAERNKLMDEYEEIARYNAKDDQFNIYNKYSFAGSIASSLSPVYSKSSPGFATLGNVFSTLSSSLGQLNQKANAFYHTQPILRDVNLDPSTIAQTTLMRGEDMAKYMLRFNCPDVEYIAIGIVADTACNVRYSFSRLELTAQVDTVLNYMLEPHPEAYEDKLAELAEREGISDPEGDTAYIGRQISETTAASSLPFINRLNGKPMPGSEYQMFLDYCVNRQDPWGRSGIHMKYTELSDAEKQKRISERDGNLLALDANNSGDPYQRTPTNAYASIVEGSLADQDWYTGKKCTEQTEMIRNFRAYTMMCSVDGSLSGNVDCTDTDRSESYSDPFYMSNDILYTSWH